MPGAEQAAEQSADRGATAARRLPIGIVRRKSLSTSGVAAAAMAALERCHVRLPRHLTVILGADWLAGLRIANQYARAVVFRLGRYHRHAGRGSIGSFR